MIAMSDLLRKSVFRAVQSVSVLEVGPEGPLVVDRPFCSVLN